MSSKSMATPFRGLDEGAVSMSVKSCGEYSRSAGSSSGTREGMLAALPSRVGAVASGWLTMLVRAMLL